MVKNSHAASAPPRAYNICSPPSSHSQAYTLRQQWSRTQRISLLSPPLPRRPLHGRWSALPTSGSPHSPQPTETCSRSSAPMRQPSERGWPSGGTLRAQRATRAQAAASAPDSSPRPSPTTCPSARTSPALDVRLLTALQVLQVPHDGLRSVISYFLSGRIYSFISLLAWRSWTVAVSAIRANLPLNLL